MQFHLTKCRIQHPTSEKAVCPFNSTHVIPHVEYDCHLKCCDERSILDAFVCKIGSSSVPKVDLVNAPVPIIGDEDWDVSDEPPVSVLERVHETSKTKPTLQALIGAPKSERKAFRTQERLRIQRVLDSQENKLGEGTSGRKIEIGEGSGTKVEVEKKLCFKGGNDLPNGNESKAVTLNCNFNYSHNRAMNAGQGQKTDSDNAGASGYQGKGRGALIRDPRNAWGTQKQSDAAGSSHFPKLMTARNYEGAVGGTPWDTGSSEDAARGRETAATKSSLVEVKFKPASPVRERDPGNPWKVNKPPSTGNASSDTTDPGDFPMLPVASRGRGRFRSKAK